VEVVGLFYQQGVQAIGIAWEGAKGYIHLKGGRIGTQINAAPRAVFRVVHTKETIVFYCCTAPCYDLRLLITVYMYFNNHQIDISR
jgi:hypothetical protein